MRLVSVSLGLSICLIGFLVGCGPESEYKTPPPPKVTAVKPTIEDVPIFLEENGQTEAVEQAIVQSRVRGILEEIKFAPDDLVTEGTPLFQIEQKEYLAAVSSAKATLSAAEASLATSKAALGVADARIAAADATIEVAKAEFKRMENLLADNAVAQSEYDAAKAELETATAAKYGVVAAKAADEANVRKAEAEIEKATADLVNANLDLERTTVIAPISGKITRNLVKRGNLVENGTELVEIVKNDPIWANFNISERFLLDIQREAQTTDNNALELGKIKVQLKRSGDDGFPFSGKLDYYDPRVDQDTGTLQLRAVFENPSGSRRGLLPGLFVRVRVQIGEYKDALLIPERAINRDQVGSYVYVIGADKKALRKNVQLGTTQNEMIVIESGLEQGDTVIVDGIQRVRPGVEVDPG